jgi:hypothetical protein
MYVCMYLMYVMYIYVCNNVCMAIICMWQWQYLITNIMYVIICVSTISQ